MLRFFKRRFSLEKLLNGEGTYGFVELCGAELVGAKRQFLSQIERFDDGKVGEEIVLYREFK